MNLENVDLLQQNLIGQEQNNIILELESDLNQQPANRILREPEIDNREQQHANNEEQNHAIDEFKDMVVPRHRNLSIDNDIFIARLTHYDTTHPGNLENLVDENINDDLEIAITQEQNIHARVDEHQSMDSHNFPNQDIILPNPGVIEFLNYFSM